MHTGGSKDTQGHWQCDFDLSTHLKKDQCSHMVDYKLLSGHWCEGRYSWWSVSKLNTSKACTKNLAEVVCIRLESIESKTPLLVFIEQLNLYYRKQIIIIIMFFSKNYSYVPWNRANNTSNYYSSWRVLISGCTHVQKRGCGHTQRPALLKRALALA